MLFSILNFFFTVIIIILFVRFFIEKYRFYGFGPIMVAIVTITEKIIKPLRQIMPKGTSYLDDNIPFVAIGITLLIRGLVIWVLGAATMNGMVLVHSAAGRISLIYSIAISFSMGVMLVSQLLIGFLFASLMVSRKGITLGSNAGFMCFQERTFAIFKYAKKFIKTNDLIKLFLVSSVVILPCGAFLATVLSMTVLQGPDAFMNAFSICMIDMVLALINFYWLILLLAILSSWIGADQYSVLVQIVRSMSDPYLGFFQRLMPWARIDFIDLSPIFAFLCINPGLTYLLSILKASILRSVMLDSIRFF